MDIIDDPENQEKPDKRPAATNWWAGYVPPPPPRRLRVRMPDPRVRWHHHPDADPETGVVPPEDLLAEGSSEFALASHLEHAMTEYRRAHGRYPRPRDMQLCIRIGDEIYA